MTTANITLNNDCLGISGDINFVTVANLWKDSLPLLAPLDKFTFDFSNVSSSNSAGLALILEWIKLAHSQKKPFELRNLPKQIHSIAKVAGIENIVK